MLIGDWGQFEISLRTRKEASFTKCTLLIVVPFSWMVKLIWIRTILTHIFSDY